MKANIFSVLLLTLAAIISCKPEIVEASGVYLNKNDISIIKGQSDVLTVAVTPSNASYHSITWVSSNPTIATVENGIVTGVSVGETVIIVKVGNFTDEAKVTVSSPTTGITLDKNDVRLEKGESATLTPTITPSDSTDPLVWTSSDEAVAVVTNGVVKAISTGVADIVASSGNCTAICKVNVVISATDISLDIEKITLTLGANIQLVATVIPFDTTEPIEWSSSDENVAIVEDGLVTSNALGQSVITVKIGNCNTCCLVTVDDISNSESVDLGLSVKWASKNLGASKPEEYGDYYAWGETEPYYKEGHSQDIPCNDWREGKTRYYWDSYKWCKGDYNELTKYCSNMVPDIWAGTGSPDCKYTLESDDDAAHVTLGGNWRVPTKEESKELVEKCTWEWICLNRVNGYKVTGPNGNSIFFPAAGFWGIKGLSTADSLGYYWSSSLRLDGPVYAWDFSFSDESYGLTLDWRCYGKSIRPVTE